MALYLVTGATGFVGRALCRELQLRGQRMRALLHRAGEGPWDESIALDLLWTPTTEKQLAWRQWHFSLCRGCTFSRILPITAGRTVAAERQRNRAIARRPH